jgi:hypothetical protein
MPVLWAISVGLCLIGSKMGLGVLNPFFIDWLPKAGGDLAAHYLGWHFYQHSPWTVPFGTIANYAWPQVTNVGYTDSIPLVAVPLRLLFGWVAAPFQYFGWWYLVTYSLGVYFSWRLLQSLGISHVLQLMAGSILLGISPYLLFRWGHDALSAHWLILAVFLVYLQVEKYKNYTPLYLSLLTLASAWIHPYMTLMVFVLSLPAWILYWKATNWRVLHRWLTVLTLLASIYISWALIGYFQISADDARTHGFGEFSANLNTFFNPLTHSSFLPALPMANDFQYEGFAYLGLGILILLLVGLLFHRNQLLPAFGTYRGMWFAVGGLTLFAISHQWTFNDVYFFKPHFSDHFTGMFRSGGRFIWPAAYALALAIMVGISRIPRSVQLCNGLFIGALIIQLADLYSFWKKDERMTSHSITYPVAPQWDSLLLNAKKMLVYPPWEQDVVHNDDFITLSLLAAPYNIPVSTGYLSRYDNPLRWNFAKDLEDILGTGNFCKYPQSIMLCGKNYTGAIQQLVADQKIKLWFLDGYYVMVPMDFSFSADRPEPIGGRLQAADMGEGFHDFLERNKSNTLLLAVSDEGSDKLCASAKDWLIQAGCQIDRLQHRDSWLAIIHNGDLIKEGYSNKDPLQWRIGLGEKIGKWISPVDLDMASGGMNNQLEPRLEVAATNHADRSRGIQIVVLDQLGMVLETACFDTYQDCYTRPR